MIVTTRVFQVSKNTPITQSDVDTVTSASNTFLATLTSTNVLDIIPTYGPNGAHGNHAFALTIIYLA